MIDFGIIAAGDGNRIKEEGSLVAKPLVEIEGQPMIGRLISLMEKCCARSLSIIVNSDMPDVWEYLRNYTPSSGCELKMISGKTPSSMHSFYELIKVMKPEDKFIITTVDTIFRGEDLIKYSEFFQNSPKDIDGVMGVTSYIDDEKPLYVDTNDDNTITAYLDTPSPTTQHSQLRPQYVSAGIYGLRQTAIPILQSCIDDGINRMRNFQRRLVEKGMNLKAFDMGKVLDVDHISDITKANSFLTT